MISVIIPTSNRADILRECLESLNKQSLLPDEIIIAHSGSDHATKDLVENLIKQSNFKIKLKYYDFSSTGSADQRNKGAEKSGGEILFFLDDDIVCESNYIEEILNVFNKGNNKRIGGVSGIVSNQTYTPLSPINKKLFNLCLEKRERSNTYAGRVVGPAVNFLPEDRPDVIQRVSWLPAACSAYRRDVFLKNKFNKDFKGYSFMEDAAMTCRIAKKYELINTTKARLYHKDLGRLTHSNWTEIGKMQVLNRWYIMTKILNKRELENEIRFFYYQLYCIMTEIGLLFKWPDVKYTLLRWIGRLQGVFIILAKLKKV